MKWINTTNNVIDETAANEGLEYKVKHICTLYQQIGWIEDVSEEDIAAQIKAAKATEQRIIADGLNPKPHGRYRLFLIPSEAQWPLLHPTKMRSMLCDLLGQNNYVNWGNVKSDYYGKPDAPKTTLFVNGKEWPIEHGFTCDDIGKIGFLVEDVTAPGYNPDIPGSLLTNMPWGEERFILWHEWAAKYQKSKPISVNYAIQSLLQLAGVDDWDNVFGSKGVIEYISQPYDSKRFLCPCGGIGGSEARWDANCDSGGNGCAVAAVVW